MPYLIATVYLKKYALGLITGVLINLPLTTTILWTIFLKLNKLTIPQKRI